WDPANRPRPGPDFCERAQSSASLKTVLRMSRNLKMEDLPRYPGSLSVPGCFRSLPSPPTACLSACGSRAGGLASELAHQELAASGFEGHDEFVVTLEAFARMLSHGAHQRIACGR